MNPESALWFLLGWFLGGFVNSVTGFGAAMAAMPFVTLGMDITLAVPASSLLVFAVSVEQMLRYRGHTDWRRILPVIIGALPGAFAGALLLRGLPPEGLKGALGLFLVAHACWGLFFEGGGMRVIRAFWGYAAGFFSTTFGTAFSFNGPPLAVYASLSGWGKEASKAGLAATFIVTSGLMLVAQFCVGAQNASTVTAALVGAPGALFGAWLGFRVSRGIGEKAYRKLFFAFIACTGFAFLRQAWQALL